MSVFSTSLVKSSIINYAGKAHITCGSIIPGEPARKVDIFLTSQLEKGLSTRYVKLMRSVLSMALQQGVRWKLVSSVPAVTSAELSEIMTITISYDSKGIDVRQLAEFAQKALQTDPHNPAPVSLVFADNLSEDSSHPLSSEV
ncbi:MAG: hypothetical protein M1288_04450 [Actinobacteria bacterium]|nr:hypothetical protein [Actinomycetota bacterium]